MVEIRVCSVCGTHNAPTASFCSRVGCGSQLTERDVIETSDIPALLNRLQDDSEQGHVEPNQISAAARVGFFGGAFIGAAAGLVLVGLAYLLSLWFDALARFGAQILDYPWDRPVDSVAQFQAIVLEHWTVPPLALAAVVGIAVSVWLAREVQKAVYK